VTVVWNGIDVARFQTSQVDAAILRSQLGVPTGATLITTTCRLFKPRDFSTLLQAMRLVVDGTTSTHLLSTHLLPAHLLPAHLLIVGDGPLREEILTQVEMLGLSKHVTLAGWRRDMPELYAASDLFVLTTWGWEGLPLTVLEAMAAGKAVVASRAGGIPEVVVEGKSGLLVDQQNPVALAEAMAKMIAEPELRSRAGIAGRQRVEEHFALPVMVDKTATVYNRVLRQ
jgi:glycosyltransferase involved in cell wall biosynthesis